MDDPNFLNGPYWVTMTNGRTGCVVLDHMRPAALPAYLESLVPDAKVRLVQPLPYPANPKLDGNKSTPFCVSPSTCAGRTSCPRAYACTE